MYLSLGLLSNNLILTFWRQCDIRQRTQPSEPIVQGFYVHPSLYFSSIPDFLFLQGQGAKAGSSPSLPQLDKASTTHTCFLVKWNLTFCFLPFFSFCINLYAHMAFLPQPADMVDYTDDFQMLAQLYIPGINAT